MLAAAESIKKLYLESGEDVRATIETGFLEHALETASLRPYFAEWGSDPRPRLRGKERSNGVNRIRTTWLDCLSDSEGKIDRRGPTGEWHLMSENLLRAREFARLFP
jgi:hypothetical protein